MTLPSSPIKAVLFDYGQVLTLPPDSGAWQRMLAITGLSDDTFHRAYWRHRHDYDRDDLNAVSYWPAVAATAGITFSSEQIESLITADVDMWTLINQPMLDWAQSLQRAGIRTGILSNIGDAMTSGLLARLPWLSGFYHCTWSYAHHLAKPEAAIYRCAIEGLGTPPANILFIDDKSENIEAACAVGLQAIRYTDHAAFEREMEERGYGYLLRPQLAPTTS
jgi:putative hydrolase of the HAD superfamily